MFCIMFATVEGGFFGAASCLRILLLTVRRQTQEEYTATAPVPSSQTMQPLIQLCFLAYRDEVALVHNLPSRRSIELCIFNLQEQFAFPGQSLWSRYTLKRDSVLHHTHDSSELITEGRDCRFFRSKCLILSDQRILIGWRFALGHKVG